MADESPFRFPVGTRVRVVNFPPNADPKNTFSFNGKVGVVQKAHAVASEPKDKSGYEYEVFFSKVEVVLSKVDPKTNKIVREAKLMDAHNFFNGMFLEQVF